MIEQKQHPHSDEEIFRILNPHVKRWFSQKFKSFCLPQKYAVVDIHSRMNVLVSAPTGSGKTLTAFLSILNDLIDSAEKGILQDKVYAIYISPLKALSNDIHVNLITPLREIEEISGKKFGIRVAVRTGDTTAHEKAKMLRKPPHILITTPESLAIVLSSIKFREHIKHVDWCIVDEVHALAENKRGVHLSLSIERLARLSSHMARIGLSATIAPLEEIAKFLVGFQDGKLRDCKVVDVQFIKNMDLKVLSPIPDLIDTPHDVMNDSLYSLLHKLIQEHRTTLIFTNTRAATERVIEHLKEKFPKEYGANIGAHHGSLSKRLRQNMESRLRQGELKAIVSSTSLELGIDIGFIDLVVCLGSPKSVSRFLQRAGRSGHQLHSTVKARIIVLDRDDLVECAVLLKSAIEKKIDRVHIPTNCLDVLAQQIYGISLEENWQLEDLWRLIKQSYCYHTLLRQDFSEVIDYLSGKHIDLEERNVYAKIWHDESTGMIGRKGKMGRVIYMTNVGTIPDESYVTVKSGDHTIGVIDESFLERLKRSDIFVLGGEKYEYQFSKGMVAYVNSTVRRPPTIPSWFSEMLPLSFDLAVEIGKFRRLMDDYFTKKKPKEEILQFIRDYLYIDEYGIRSIYSYMLEQFQFSQVPSEKKIVVESYNDGRQTYHIFHTLFGRRVNDVLSRAVAYAISRTQHIDVEIGINDNGFYVASHRKIQLMRAFRMLKSKELREVAKLAIEKSEVLKRRFRHCAGRSMMILKTYKGRTKRVGRQQVSSMILLNAVRRISENFVILREARREVLEDLMDVDHAIKILKSIEDQDIILKEESADLPSPFAFNIVLQGKTDIMKFEDRLLFLQRMHENVLAKIGKRYVRDPEDIKFDYKKFFNEVEEKKKKELEDRLIKFKEEIDVTEFPTYVKVEAMRLADGNTDIRKDALSYLKQNKLNLSKESMQFLDSLLAKQDF